MGSTRENVCPHLIKSFGVQPRSPEHDLLKRPVSLKKDLHWGEVSNLQMVMRRADFWTDFPEKNFHLISAEVKAGDEPQRIDLLYVRDDGGVFPCELKVGGEDPDTHGQIIRYIADLDGQQISKDWIKTQRAAYFDRKMKGQPRQSMDVFIDWVEFEKKLPNVPEYRAIKKHGIIIDEGFPSKLLRAVKYLNEQAGFSLRLIRAQAYVADEFTDPDGPHLMRLDFEEQEIECPPDSLSTHAV